MQYIKLYTNFEISRVLRSIISHVTNTKYQYQYRYQTDTDIVISIRINWYRYCYRYLSRIGMGVTMSLSLVSLSVSVWCLVSVWWWYQVYHEWIYLVSILVSVTSESEKRSNLPRNRLQHTYTFLTIAVNFGQNRHDFYCRNQKGGEVHLFLY